MKIERLVRTDNRKSVYVVHGAKDKNEALQAVKDKRKMKEDYRVWKGFLNSKHELYRKPEYGNTMVYVVEVR